MAIEIKSKGRKRAGLFYWEYRSTASMPWKTGESLLQLGELGYAVHIECLNALESGRVIVTS